MSKFTLKEIADLITDGDWIESKDQSTDGIRLIQTGNIGLGTYLDKVERAKFISQETFVRLNCKEVKAGDILISRLPDPVGRACIIPEFETRCITAVDCTIIRVDNKKCIPKYFNYFCMSSKYFNSINQHIVGSTRKRISRKNLENIEIYLPPLLEQQKAVRKLDSASELINLRKKQLEELDNLIKSVFYDMFGDPVTNEKGWDIKKICDISTIETGSTPSRNNTHYYNGSIPWIKTGEIAKGYIFSSEEHVSETALEETNCKVFPRDTILIAMYGQGKTRGQAGMLKIEASTNQACAAILPSELYVSEYLYRLISLRYEELRELGRGGNQPNLNLSMIKGFAVILPPLTLQNKFAQLVSKIEEQKALVQKAIDESQYLFNSLMSKYFD